MHITLISSFAALSGILDFFFLFLFFHRRIKKRILYRIGSEEYQRRTKERSKLGQFLFTGMTKHISPVWLTMNALLAPVGALGIALGIVGGAAAMPWISLAGLGLSAGMAVLSLCLIAVELMFGFLKMETQLQIQQAVVVLFFAILLMAVCLMLFGD